MIVIGATVAAYKCDGSEYRWLARAPLRCDGEEVRYFLAAEVGQGRDEGVEALARFVASIGGEVWRFSLDDGEYVVTGGNRLHHITTGRNLIASYATERGAKWILHLDTDVSPDPEALPKLLELDRPFVAGHIPRYRRSGPPATGFPPEWQVQTYQESAGFWLVHRDIFQRIRWRTDLDEGLTDDPAYHADVRDFLGIDMLVRRDVMGHHDPNGRPVEMLPMSRRTIDPRGGASLPGGVKFAVVLPVWLETQEHVDLTYRVLELVEQEAPDLVLVYVNGGPLEAELRWPGTLDPKVMLAHDWPFYAMWNDGVREARQRLGDDAAVVIVNNDIEFLPGTLRRMAAVLGEYSDVGITYPDWRRRVSEGLEPDGLAPTAGTYRHGGMSGWCFAVRTTAPEIDERFRCWGGDDDLAFKMQQQGQLQVRLNGWPIDHLNEATMRYRPELQERRDDDMELLRSLWGNR